MKPPALRREQTRLAALGGSFLGICGDVNHTYGFHLPGCATASGDYSLRYGPGNPSYAAAIDIGMDFPGSRQWLLWLVAQVRAGRLPAVVEIIGQPLNAPVLYWAAWHGWAARRYTGAGHDRWTHVGCRRDVLATAADVGILAWTPTPPPPPPPGPPESGVDWTERMIMALPTLRAGAGLDGPANQYVRNVQALLGAHGYSAAVDGRFGPRTAGAVRAFQTARRIPADGVVGRVTHHHLADQQALLG